MKPLASICAALLSLPSFLAAQDAPTTVTGSVSTGARAVDNDTDSSKLTEYRDLRSEAFLPRLTLSIFDASKRTHFDFAGSNTSLDDQRLHARGGRYGTFDLALDWTSVPHNYSNKARTPYFQSAPGRFEVAANVPLTFRRLATAAVDAPSVLGSDALIAAYQAGSLAPTPLGVQSGYGRVALGYTGLEDFRFGVAYDRRVKDGLKPTYGPIGDRPPRTLNIQLTEPVDYRTQDVTLAAAWAGARYQAELSYQFSDFANTIDTLTWENVFTTPTTPGGTTDRWDRAVSVFGRRPLPPDNRYHNASLAFGAELPAQSHLSATVAYGRLTSDETLLPYSFNSDVLVNSTLPRATSAAEIVTKQVLVDYVVSPADRLTLRAWARHNGLDNRTPEDQWQYVTSDTANLNGTVTYVNKRVNPAYALDRTTAGIDTTFRISPWRGSLALGYERDSVDRQHREADTAEDRLTASFRARPASWARLKVRYTFGKRDGDYDPFVTREGYWYAPGEATDLNNPQFTFDNHPDMVRYDVADRARHQADVSLTLNRSEKVSLTASVRYRDDDFDSGVRPIQPLASTGFGEASATSPGDQLGLLTDRRLRCALDGSYLPFARVTLSGFLNYDRGTTLQRGLEFDENHKADPGAIRTADLGPWTRASSQWTADSEDRTWSAGLGSHFRLGGRVTLAASYTLSLGDVRITYAGFGVTNASGVPYPPNTQYAFSSPPTVNQDYHVVDVRLDFPLVRDVMATLGYGYERFRTDDWMQATSLPWVEPVGSEFLLRDTSRSHQWGNRLFNLGSFLAPGYDAHAGWLAFTYRF
jgi:MtrB/PioB family decaheme-associated outer membrane protein